jgi:hypothetical protein
MENILRTIKSEVIEFNKGVAEQIQEYKIMLQIIPDEILKDFFTKMLRCEQYCYILNIGIINEVKDIKFFRSALANLIQSETELTEVVNEQVKNCNVEEKFYLELCNVLKDKYNTLKEFCQWLEDANLHPEKYNY